MPTTVARLACDEPAARQLAAALGEHLNADGAVCAAFEGDGGQWHVAIYFRAAPDRDSVRALVTLTAGDAAARALAFETVADTDWVKQSLTGLAPVRAGRFVLHGAHDRARVPVNAIGIEIEAALAFGTGHHGTTRGCLLALDALAKRRVKRRKTSRRHPEVRAKRASKGGGRSSFEGRLRRPPQDDGLRAMPRILDLGTGSGVLAIAAAKAFYTRVIASDIDIRAVEAARANARLNCAAPLVTLLRARGTTARVVALHAPYDLIFANILLGPLLRLAVPIKRLSGANARVVLSGLLPAQANAVLANYRAQELALERRITLTGWTTLVLARKQNRPGRGRPGRLRW
jgi:ribosomal protein L11 methyltransferase